MHVKVERAVEFVVSESCHVFVFFHNPFFTTSCLAQIIVDNDCVEVGISIVYLIQSRMRTISRSSGWIGRCIVWTKHTGARTCRTHTIDAFMSRSTTLPWRPKVVTHVINSGFRHYTCCSLNLRMPFSLFRHGHLMSLVRVADRTALITGGFVAVVVLAALGTLGYYKLGTSLGYLPVSRNAM